MKEFNLSDKIIEEHVDFIYVLDVKEFIKKYEKIIIKEDITSLHKQRLILFLKELAGDKLK